METTTNIISGSTTILQIVLLILLFLLTVLFVIDISSLIRNSFAKPTEVKRISNRGKILALLCALAGGEFLLLFLELSNHNVSGEHFSIVGYHSTFFTTVGSLIVMFFLGYLALYLMNRYMSYQNGNARKELRLIISFIFVWLLVSVLIIHLIHNLALCNLYPLQYLIFWSSLTATFLSTVFADDQSQRIKNGTFGALAAGGITTVVTLIQKDNVQSIELLLYSFFGSTLGGLFGWLVFVLIATITFYRYGVLFPFVELITSGFGKFRDQIILLENNPSLSKLQLWMQRFSNEYRMQYTTITSDSAFINIPDHLKVTIYRQMIRFVLMAMVEQFNLIFGTVQFRTTIIRFNKKADGTFEKGYHDFKISYYGGARRFKDKPFDEKTKAYEMIIGRITDKSQTFETADASVPTRDSRDRYVSFILFKLTDRCILSVDWGQEQTKQRLEILEDRINEYLVPLLRDLMKSLETLDPEVPA